jgi:hypothetical protein
MPPRGRGGGPDPYRALGDPHSTNSRLIERAIGPDPARRRPAPLPARDDRGGGPAAAGDGQRHHAEAATGILSERPIAACRGTLPPGIPEASSEFAQGATRVVVLMIGGRDGPGCGETANRPSLLFSGQEGELNIARPAGQPTASSWRRIRHFIPCALALLKEIAPCSPASAERAAASP